MRWLRFKQDVEACPKMESQLQEPLVVKFEGKLFLLTHSERNILQQFDCIKNNTALLPPGMV